MKPDLTTCRNPLRGFLAGLLALVLLIPALAQTPATGTLTGRIFNPRTGEYVRNAEISVAGSNLATATGTGGTYRLPNVPAGPVEIIVSYAGYSDIRSPAVVTSGQTTVLDLELTSAAAGTAMEDGTVSMAEFVVSTEVEGNAKSLMEQRNSMDLGRSIASDVFGDVTEGNVGEFLKYLPGIEMEYVEADTRGPRLGGLNPEYTGVSVDGMKSASADGFMQYGGTENGSTGGGGRSFSFEQVSINSIESIEISRVTPPNLDADAPAGTETGKLESTFRLRQKVGQRGLKHWVTGRQPAFDGNRLARHAHPPSAFIQKLSQMSIAPACDYLLLWSLARQGCKTLGDCSAIVPMIACPALEPRPRRCSSVVP